MCISIGITEAGTSQLNQYKINVHATLHAKRLLFLSATVVHRVVLWLALVSTIIILKMKINRPRSAKPKKNHSDSIVCSICGRNNSDMYVDAHSLLRKNIRKKLQIKRYDKAVSSLFYNLLN